MLKKIIITIAAVATVAIMTMDSAEAKNRRYKHRVHHVLTTGSIPKFDSNGSNAPFAYKIFCIRNPSQCRPSSVGTVAMTSRVRATLASVNTSVNRSMHFKADLGEEWSMNGGSGDCEDYALTKRAKLIRSGIPGGALRMAVVRTEKGEGHAILIVKTTQGEFALDNRRNDIRPRSETGYRFITMASADPKYWN